MKNTKVDLNIPIIFQKLNIFETGDTRFIPVKIWLMHLGENFNGSYFSKKAVTKAIPTLANTPILAYIEDNSDGESDFSDHRYILVEDENGYEYKYVGLAVGTIPESNNAKFEMRVCDDGIEREFLTVEGLVWQGKWQDAPDIFNRDLVKKESMELDKYFTGHEDDNGIFHFEDFKFYGACALGKDFMPAMQNATIELNFNNKTLQTEIQDKMQEFKQYIFMQNGTTDVKNELLEEGGSETLDKKLEIILNHGLKAEDLDFEFKDMAIEELELKITEFKVKNESKSEDETNPDFALNSQLVNEIIEKLSVEKVIEDWGSYNRYYFNDFDDEKLLIYAWDEEDWKLYSFKFVKNGDSVEIDFESKARCKFKIVPFDEGDNKTEFEFELPVAKTIEGVVAEKDKSIEKLQLEFDTYKTTYATPETEVLELKEFKENKLKVEREQAVEDIFSKFESQLGKDKEFVALKETNAEISVEDIEKECYAILGKQSLDFSISKNNKRTNETPKLPVNTPNLDEDVYGGIFAQYNKK